MLKKVLLTDYAWPDLSIEEQIVGEAGFELIHGPSSPPAEEDVVRLVALHRPAAILTCWAHINAQAIAASPDLRVVARLGVGLDNIDVAQATRQGVLVTNVPDYCVEEVSDHALAMVLAWTRGLHTFHARTREGHWEPETARLKRLSELVVGIVGYGRIGRRTAAKLKAWGGRIVVNTPGRVVEDGVSHAPLEALLAACDVVIVHAPLTPATKHLFDARRIALMRPGSLLVNVSRGGLVDTEALTAALTSGQLGAAGLDVLDGEPHIPASLAKLPNVMLTPHVAFSSNASLAELRRRACVEVVRVLSGSTALHAVNRPTPHP